MMHLIAAGTTAVLALASLPHSVYAESDATNQNLTLRFFQDSQEDSCSYANTTSALTFTTSSIPLISHCFNFEELFGGNSSTGFVNQSRNLLPAYAADGDVGIHWALPNRDAYDSSANYSSVLYRQHVANPGSDKYEPGHFGDRRVVIYPGEDCSEKDESMDKGLSPWYGFGCWSESEGDCGSVPYKIASFNVQPALEEKDEHGKCWVFAERGAAASVHSTSHVVVGSMLSVALAMWLAL